MTTQVYKARPISTYTCHLRRRACAFRRYAQRLGAALVLIVVVCFERGLSLVSAQITGVNADQYLSFITLWINISP